MIKVRMVPGFEGPDDVLVELIAEDGGQITFLLHLSEARELSEKLMVATNAIMHSIESNGR
jgi:hypothetical protein